MCDDLDAGVIEDNGWLPRAVVKARATPSWDLHPCVIIFAHQHVAGSNRAFGRPPRSIGDNRLRRAVGEANLELRQQARPIAVGLAGVAVQVATVPAVA